MRILDEWINNENERTLYQSIPEIINTIWVKRTLTLTHFKILFRKSLSQKEISALALSVFFFFLRINIITQILEPYRHDFNTELWLGNPLSDRSSFLGGSQKSIMKKKELWCPPLVICIHTSVITSVLQGIQTPDLVPDK